MKQKFPTEKEVDKERQLQKEKYYYGTGSQSAYSAGFIDAVNWLRRYIDNN